MVSWMSVCSLLFVWKISPLLPAMCAQEGIETYNRYTKMIFRWGHLYFQFSLIKPSKPTWTQHSTKRREAFGLAQRFCQAQIKLRIDWIGSAWQNIIPEPVFNPVSLFLTFVIHLYVYIFLANFLRELQACTVHWCLLVQWKHNKSKICSRHLAAIEIPRSFGRECLLLKSLKMYGLLQLFFLPVLLAGGKISFQW